MTVISGTAYWASVATPNTAFDSDGVWQIDVCLDDDNLAKVQGDGLNVKNKGDDRGNFITIKRKVRNARGDSNQPPKASFSISKNGLSVNFSNSSTDDKAVTSSSWDFGDGTYSNANSPTHTFVAAGSYQVTLTVSDAQGLTSQTSQQVSVSSGDTGGCSGIATWDPTKIYLSGSKVQLNNKVYQANWWVQGLNPESSGQWGPWSMVGLCN